MKRARRRATSASNGSPASTKASKPVGIEDLGPEVDVVARRRSPEPEKRCWKWTRRWLTPTAAGRPSRSSSARSKATTSTGSLEARAWIAMSTNAEAA
jgi:hypothetical protein